MHKNLRSYGTRINLLDIGEEGYEFTYKKGDEAELDKAASEAVEGLKDFEFTVNIMKTGDIYTAQGSFRLEKNDQCSLCAADIEAPVKTRFVEYLMNEARGMEQKGHAPHSGLNLENDQEVTFVHHHELHVTEFMRELFAVSVIPYPKCADVKACEKRQQENAAHLDKIRLEGHPAFSVLEKLKKN